MSLVVGKDVTRAYNNKQGLHGVDFTFEQGRIIALAGGNGAGKSTLIRLLIGEETMDRGTITWQAEKSLHYMPDDLNFPLMLTAEEVIRLLAKFKKLPTSHVETVLKRVGLWQYRKQRVRQFSRGMRQRLNLAQCLLGDEQLIILDEPTNGLDLVWIAQLKQILREEQQAGKTILFSTHLLSFAEELADDVLLLHEGRVLMHGSLSAVLEQNKATHLEQLFLREMQLYTVNQA
ncbi:ABC transporter ATP-binding protein [Kurthia massiliensis]|uniref:ABC transporter ATP-binding protein n=1 Tax=Kurthia massiliensis TaxID=1033739 RepID=UPI000289DB9F|nr:ABC transporter ATP-binding protein [Kurthia massiliensis]